MALFNPVYPSPCSISYHHLPHLRLTDRWEKYNYPTLLLHKVLKMKPTKTLNRIYIKLFLKKGSSNMKEWWQGRKNKKRRDMRRNDQYSLIDLFLDVLVWIPELLLLPFRIIYWLLRGVGRLIGEGFN